MERPIRVAVVGGSDASRDEIEVAEALGAALAEGGAIVITGGRGGVMEAASQGCFRAGGLTVGLLPGSDPEEANAWVSIPLATGLGEARNALVVGAAECVVAVGGSWGTLSEVSLARRRGTPVGVLGSPLGLELPLPSFESAEEAATWALEAAASHRGPSGERE